MATTNHAGMPGNTEPTPGDTTTGTASDTTGSDTTGTAPVASPQFTAPPAHADGSAGAVDLDENEAFEETDDAAEDGDPQIAAAFTWSIADSAGLRRRRNRVQRLIDDGAMLLHPQFLEWLRFVLNWDEVDKALPKPRKDGRWQHRGGKRSMSGYRVYYLELLMPAVVLLQQILNYRIGLGRTLPGQPTDDHPVSAGTGLTDADGRNLAALMHTYATDKGLQDTLRDAHRKVVAYRTSEGGWDPLRDLIYRDGVEDGGLWLQTAFAPLNPDGTPNLEAAQASLAPADAASRKAVCDDRIDPEGKLAALPLLAPRHGDVYTIDDKGEDGAEAKAAAAPKKDPNAPITTAEAAGVILGRLKTALSRSKARYLDELDDELRELLQTTVMPVRLVYYVEDSSGQPANLDAVTLFREIQEHYHGRDHLGHPGAEAERLVADKAREALYGAASTGKFTIVDHDDETGIGLNGDYEPVPICWTRPLLDVLAGRGDYSALTALGLPENRMGAGVAAAMLVYGSGPERAVIGKALGSRRNGGRYDSVLEKSRAALLREMTFPDLVDGVNQRVFEPLPASTMMANPLTGWDGDTEALVTRIADGTATPTDRAVFDIVTVVAGVENEMALVDLGSQGTGRGFFRAKTMNAVTGMEVIVDKDRKLKKRIKLPAGELYVRALLSGRLLRDEPTPLVVGGVALDAATTAQWKEWAAGGIGLLDDDGTPITHEAPAVLVDDQGAVVTVQGQIQRTFVEVPKPVGRDVLDAFSNQRMVRLAIDEYESGGGGAAGTRPLTVEETADAALESAVSATATIEAAVQALETISGTGHVFEDAHHHRIEGVARDLRVMASPFERNAVGARLDRLVTSNETRRQHAAAQHAATQPAANDEAGSTEAGAVGEGEQL